jgi:hypothetical protein
MSNFSANTTTYSTTTNATITTPVDVLLNVLNTLDFISRYTALATEFLYILVLCFAERLHKRTLLYMNHTCLVNMIMPILIIGYIFSTVPSFPDPSLNYVLCHMSEFFYKFALYIKMYSIWLLSIYRYLAVYKINIYKKLNSSLILLILPLLCIWIISAAFPLILKYSLNTTTSAVACLDGFTPLFLNSLLYIIFHYAFMLFLPMTCIILNYVWIVQKLNSVGGSVRNKAKVAASAPTVSNSTRQTTTAVTSATGGDDADESNLKNKKNSEKQRRFADQFITMCADVLITLAMEASLSVRGVVPNYFALYYYARPALKIVNFFSVAMLPLISLYYTFERLKYLKRKLNWRE